MFSATYTFSSIGSMRYRTTKIKIEKANKEIQFLEIKNKDSVDTNKNEENLSAEIKVTIERSKTGIVFQ